VRWVMVPPMIRPHCKLCLMSPRTKRVLFGDNTKTYLVSKVTVRRGTRIVGRFCIQADNTVGGNSSIVILEEDVVADAVILKLRASSIVQRGVSVGNAAGLASSPFWPRSRRSRGRQSGRDGAAAGR